MPLTPDNWEVRNGRLCRDYVFSDFREAFAFMTACALEAERANHHPDWRNAYNRVEVSLITHEARSLTEKDYRLARAFESIWERMFARAREGGEKGAGT
jgi:4a-hydroxytetrahydrobiopterin dehydratase